jgi:hypothetical protein
MLDKEVIMTTKGYIRYKSDYKYQLASSYEIQISIRPKTDIETDFIDLDRNGTLTVKKGYAWDGPSGPVKDTKKNMRASLVHDALYQLMRNKSLNTRTYRKAADREFRDICKEDGVSNFRASVYYKALRKFGRPAASPENKKKIARAPKK